MIFLSFLNARSKNKLYFCSRLQNETNVNILYYGIKTLLELSPKYDYQ